MKTPQNMPAFQHYGEMILLLLCLCISPFYGVYAQKKADSTKPRLTPMRISQDFEINKRITQPVWNEASSVFIKNQYTPNDQVKAPVKTEVNVLYSDRYLYIRFKAHDPNPSKIRANITERDNLSGDFVGFILDPFKNNQQAYEFFVSPLGIQTDAKRSAYGEDKSFDMLWYSNAEISDFGYTAVIKIPFESLNFPQSKVQNWSINFIRVYPRNSRYQLFWTNASLRNSCILCQNGRLEQLSGIESSNPVDIIPYATGYQESKLNNPSDGSSGLDHGPIQARVGGSISYTPTSTSSINAVINPDFSQVETDAAQISVNEPFALSYPEKRPFFLKQANLFQTNENLFYSRSINKPLTAAKYTEKSNKYTLGFLSAFDRDVGFIVPGRLSSNTIKTNKNAQDNILRGKYFIGSQSYVGGLITTRNYTGSYNYLGNIDWQLFLGRKYYFNGSLGHSITKEINDTTLFNSDRKFGNSGFNAALNGEKYEGNFLSSTLERKSKYYNFSVSYKSFSPTFQAQNGFINNADRRLLELDQSISYYPNKPWWPQGNFNMSATWQNDFSGKLLEKNLRLGFSNNLSGQTRISLNYFPLKEELFNGKYFSGLRRSIFQISTNPTSLFSLDASLVTGRDIYRTSQPVKGKLLDLSTSATIRPTNQLILNLDYSYSSLSPLNGGEDYYSGNIFRFKSTYNFSRKLFARFIIQYNSFNEQIQLYPLLSYNFNAFTKFYIGMTDYVRKVDLDKRKFSRFAQTNRQFFVKFQYLIQY